MILLYVAAERGKSLETRTKQNLIPVLLALLSLACLRFLYCTIFDCSGLPNKLLPYF